MHAPKAGQGAAADPGKRVLPSSTRAPRAVCSWIVDLPPLSPSPLPPASTDLGPVERVAEAVVTCACGAAGKLLQFLTGTSEHAAAQAEQEVKQAPDVSAATGQPLRGARAEEEVK